MKNKKKYIEENEESKEPKVDAELLRAYMMGAANPRFSNKNFTSDDVVDLHLSSSKTGKGMIPETDALFHQMEEFERALDKAIASNKMEFRVIHGLGKGKLKQAIHKLLAAHPQVRSFTNDYHSKYGYGSTLIVLK